MSSTRERPSIASTRSIARSTDISAVKNAEFTPAWAIRSAIASASDDLPTPTSPPRTTKSPRRSPPTKAFVHARKARGKRVARRRAISGGVDHSIETPLTTR